MIGRASAPFRDFISMFGLSPKVIAVVWNITPFDDDVKLLHMLWALNFLKTYATESVLIQLAGNVDRKTYRKRVWSVLSSFKAKAKEIVRHSPTLLHVAPFHLIIVILTLLWMYLIDKMGESIQRRQGEVLQGDC